MGSRQMNYFPSQIQYSNSTDLHLEFQESDLLWNDEDDNDNDRTPSSPEQSIPPPRSRKRSMSGISSSLPVNIPDWSKILGKAVEESDQDEDEDERVPPHEYAARQLARRSGMMVAFSVQEGVGRTLKGRDLRRLRNAIWKQTGFED